MSLTTAFLIGTAIVLVLHNAYLQVSLSQTNELLDRVAMDNHELYRHFNSINSTIINLMTALRTLSDGLPK